jgi:hypothetical protein
MVRIVLAIGILLSAHGIARADRPWDHGSPTDVDERDGWEVGADLVGSPLSGGGVELEGALRHDGVLAHVARVAWTEETIENDSLTSDPGMFVNRYWVVSFSERACAWGVLCGELGLGGRLGWEHVMGSESDLTGEPFGLFRVTIRLPVGPPIFRFGGEVDAGGASGVSGDLFLGLSIRW